MPQLQQQRAYGGYGSMGGGVSGSGGVSTVDYGSSSFALPTQPQPNVGGYGGAITASAIVGTPSILPGQMGMMSPTMAPTTISSGYSTPPASVPLGTRSPHGGNSVSQELLVQQAQHQITSAQFAVGTNSIEEQLRRLKAQTQQIAQEHQQIRMAQQSQGPNAWMYPKQ
ncbi:hypothetical protein BC830DRAFT_1133231 [Chytriomyces sp. MP71]|nr:hypothetical protein BC830DRAFT_1133231 [Chytriomyces sp. MP71]